MKKATVTHQECTCSKNYKTPIKYDPTEMERQEFRCDGCGLVFSVQVQDCPYCDEESLVTHPGSFESGKYSCWNCKRISQLDPWEGEHSDYIPSKKKNLVWEWVKNSFKSKKPTMAFFVGQKCENCSGESVFLDISSTKVQAICADCSKEFNVCLTAKS